MENKLYFIGVKCPLEQLAEHFGLVEEGEERHIAYFGFWNNVVFFEYNQDTHLYRVKEIVDSEVQYHDFDEEKFLFRYMDEHYIEFVSDLNPLGEIFRSYAAAYLSVIRWVADVAYSRDLYRKLLED